MRALSLLAIFALALILILGSISQIQSSNIKENTRGFPVGWTDDIRITDYYETDQHCGISISNDNVHIIWERWIDSPSGYEIYYTKSDNQGKTWALPFQLSENDFSVRNPDIFAGGTNISTVWSERDPSSGNSYEIYYRNSADGGISWNSDKRISIDDGNNSEAPFIAVNGSNNIHVVWSDVRHGILQAEVYYKRSTDGGVIWDDALGNPNLDRRLTHDLTGANPISIGINNSNIHVLFFDDRDGSFDLYYIRSVDNGVIWDDGLGNVNQERKLTSNATSHGPGTISVEGSTIHLVWVDEVWPGPYYYIYYKNSTDNGATWNPIQLLVDSGMAYNPSIDVIGNDVHIAWDDWRVGGSTKEIYYMNSTDGGASWGTELRLTALDGNHSAGPKIAISENYKHITWVDERNGNDEIYYKRFPDFPTDTDSPAHTNESPPPDSYRDAPGTNISIHVSDPSGVNESTIQLWVNGSLVSHNLSPITDGYNVSYISPGFDPGVVECRIVADDNCSNTLDFTWNFTVLALYEIPLQEGWNLISVPHVQVDTAINEVLRDIDGKWNNIQWYDASDGNDHWKTNATYKPQQLNDLFYLNRSMAFWINITEPNVNLTVRGHISTLTEIPFFAGWNLVGYSTQTTETVANALWGTGADRVEVFNATEPYRIKEVGPTYVMKPGEGYWVHVPVDTVWVVDW